MFNLCEIGIGKNDKVIWIEVLKKQMNSYRECQKNHNKNIIIIIFNRYDS